MGPGLWEEKLTVHSRGLPKNIAMGLETLQIWMIVMLLSEEDKEDDKKLEKELAEQLWRRRRRRWQGRVGGGDIAGWSGARLRAWATDAALLALGVVTYEMLHFPSHTRSTRRTCNTRGWVSSLERRPELHFLPLKPPPARGFSTPLYSLGD